MIVWIHWVADFVLQTDQMAQNKSKSNRWLSIHIIVYSLPWFIFGWKFALVNAAAHWLIDWVTSRITSQLWAKKDVHNFFVVIGFDQAAHLTILILSAVYL
jgi:hypothetical protein